MEKEMDARPRAPNSNTIYCISNGNTTSAGRTNVHHTNNGNESR